jgi:hypothetical protein
VFSVSQDYLFGLIYAVNRIVHNRGRPYLEYIVHCVARADVNRSAIIDCYVLRLSPYSMHTRLAPRPAPLLPITTARSDFAAGIAAGRLYVISHDPHAVQVAPHQPMPTPAADPEHAHGLYVEVVHSPPLTQPNRLSCQLIRCARSPAGIR